MTLTYYLDQIEAKLKKICNQQLSNELSAEYNMCFENLDDEGLLRELRVLNERLNKTIDSQNMD